jgi:hypothetical protein
MGIGKFGFANQLALIACFITYKKWMQEKSIPIINVYLKQIHKQVGSRNLIT